ncbi:MAG: hypothetical protein M1546_03560, partial [Chloroflexi bacterium]|nr:hypothetical protein [Chloroflexota bacterium]
MHQESSARWALLGFVLAVGITAVVFVELESLSKEHERALAEQASAEVALAQKDSQIGALSSQLTAKDQVILGQEHQIQALVAQNSEYSRTIVFLQGQSVANAPASAPVVACTQATQAITPGQVLPVPLAAGVAGSAGPSSGDLPQGGAPEPPLDGSLAPWLLLALLAVCPAFIFVYVRRTRSEAQRLAALADENVRLRAQLWVEADRVAAQRARYQRELHDEHAKTEALRRQLSAVELGKQMPSFGPVNGLGNGNGGVVHQVSKAPRSNGH